MVNRYYEYLFIPKEIFLHNNDVTVFTLHLKYYLPSAMQKGNMAWNFALVWMANVGD